MDEDLDINSQPTNEPFIEDDEDKDFPFLRRILEEISLNDPE